MGGWRTRGGRRWEVEKYVPCGVWPVPCEVWCVTSDVWDVMCYKWCVRCDVLQVTCDMWCVGCAAIRVLQPVDSLGARGLWWSRPTERWLHAPVTSPSRPVMSAAVVMGYVCLSACMPACLSVTSVGLQVSSTSSLLSFTRSRSEFD